MLQICGLGLCSCRGAEVAREGKLSLSALLELCTTVSLWMKQVPVYNGPGKGVHNSCNSCNKLIRYLLINYDLTVEKTDW